MRFGRDKDETATTGVNHLTMRLTLGRPRHCRLYLAGQQQRCRLRCSSDTLSASGGWGTT